MIDAADDTDDSVDCTLPGAQAQPAHAACGFAAAVVVLLPASVPSHHRDAYGSPVNSGISPSQLGWASQITDYHMRRRPADKTTGGRSIVVGLLVCFWRSSYITDEEEREKKAG